MTFEALYLIIIEQNPNLQNKTVTITPENFKKALRTAYDNGFKEGENSKSLFENMFGKGFGN